MKATRLLFVVTGYPEHIKAVLGSLQFKGLMVFPPGTPVSSDDLKSAFGQNRSVACSIENFPDGLPDNAILVLATTDITPFAHDLAFPRIIDVSSGNIAQQFMDIANLNGYDIGDLKSNSSGLPRGITPEDYTFGTSTQQFTTIAESSGYNIGNQSSSSPLLDDGPTQADCAYCKYLMGNPLDNEEAVYESNTCFALPTVGEFRTGYILIIPKRHIMSMAQLNTTELKEFEEAIEDVEFLLRQIYREDILIWENGSGASGVGKAKDSIVHAHLHLCPSHFTSSDIETISSFPFEDVTLENLREHELHPYLLIRTPDKENWRITDSSRLYVPRQYVRQILAEECGCIGEEYNWRRFPFRDKMAQTVSDFHEYLDSHWDSLSDRIKARTSV